MTKTMPRKTFILLLVKVFGAGLLLFVAFAYRDKLDNLLWLLCIAIIGFLIATILGVLASFIVATMQKMEDRMSLRVWAAYRSFLSLLAFILMVVGGAYLYDIFMTKPIEDIISAIIIALFLLRERYKNLIQKGKS